MRALILILVVIGIGCTSQTPFGHDPNMLSPGGCPWRCCERPDGTLPCTTNCCTPDHCPCEHAPKPS